MKIEYYKFWSRHLQQDMELKVYGQSGKPVLVFPSFCGRFYDYENFGMIEAASKYIEEGLFQFCTVDSIDSQTWGNFDGDLATRGRRHENYNLYITKEVVPFIHDRRGEHQMLLTTGCSMGGYHSANFFFRHPDIFDSLISLSGVYDLRLFVDNSMDKDVKRNSPLLYLPDLTDEWYLRHYRRSTIIICSGQGAWEDRMLADIAALRGVLAEKQIHAWIDLWGKDVNHDWPWWRKMLAYFLGKLVEGVPVPQTEASQENGG